MNTKARHMPGPWELVIRSTDQGIYGFVGPVKNRDTIARIECPHNEGEANAHLIAAAPEMYEFIESLIASDSNPLIREHAAQLAAKARGE